MPDETRLDDLLLKWDDLRRRGEDVTADELTLDCPELTEQLSARIEAIKAMDWLDSRVGDADDRTHLTNLVAGEGPVKLPDSSLSSEELVQQLSETELMSAREVSRWLDDHPDPGLRADAKAMAAQLIEEGKLTPYQATILLQGQTEKLLVDKYLILDSLDAGGMGVVFKAIHRPMNRVVALKMLSPHLLNSPDKVQRFRREVQVAASLTHPNIVTAYDADESKGVHFLVMEHVQGKDLRKVVDSSGPLIVDQAVNCLLQAARGLAHAHKKGVIHRDVKPSNLMLSADGAVKVLDLGLARMDEGLQLVEDEASTHLTTQELDDTPADTREHLTHAGTLMGTVAFMAPEQAVDTHNVDHRADIYSLGCTLYYLLVGEAPFRGENPMQTVIGHREGPIPSLRRFRPDVPEELGAICQRMLAKQTNDRPQSMQEVIAALEALETVATPKTDRPRIRTSIGDAFDDAPTVLQESAVHSTELGSSTGARSSRSAGRSIRKRLLYVTAATLFAAVVAVVVNRNPFDTLDNSVETAPETPMASEPRSQIESPGDFALEFDDPNEYVQIPTLHYDGGPITLEALVEWKGAANDEWRAIFRTLGDQGAWLSISDWVKFHVDDSDRRQSAGAPSSLLPPGRRIHLAGVYDGERASLFVDGMKVGYGKSIEGMSYSGRFSQVGWDAFSFPGEIGEIRVSNVARYAASFTAVPRRFNSDEHTLALYHCDNGEGDVLVDSSGNGHHGRIHGAAWVRTDDSPRPTEPADEFNWTDYLPADAPAPAIAPLNADQAASLQQAWAQFLNVPVQREVELRDGQTLAMVLIPPGEFLMGSSEEQRTQLLADAEETSDSYEAKLVISEGIHRKSRITRPFYLARHEFTNAQWEAVMGELHAESEADEPTHPLFPVSWEDTQQLVSALNQSQSRHGMEFYLPTETQWEYACRAGTESLWHFGGDDDLLKDHAWFRSNSGGETHSAGTLLPNPWGLHDMYGNVWEICGDWYGVGFPIESSGVDPTGPADGEFRVRRGGARSLYARWCRSANRAEALVETPTGRSSVTGFRVAAAINIQRPGVNPHPNFALQFDGQNDYVETPVRFDVTQPLTVEAFITVPKLPDSNQVALCDANLAGFGLGPRENGKWRMDIQAQGVRGIERDEVGYVRIESDEEIDYGRRTHVAAVFDGRIVRLYIDGRLQNRPRAVEDVVPSTLPIFIGANPNDDVGTAENFLGTIDEVRISNIACYTTDFTPLQHHEPDKHTLALYHFDEGEGDVLVDASGNDNQGEIYGASWVRLDDDPNSIPALDPPDSALQFDGIDDVVMVPGFRHRAVEQFTYEVRVRLNSELPVHRPLQLLSSPMGTLNIGNDNHWSFLQYDSASESVAFFVCQPQSQTVIPDRDYHLAATWDGEVCRLFVDGRKVDERPLQEFSADIAIDVFSIGGQSVDRDTGESKFSWAGIVDEIRISNVARYVGDFTPAARFESDEQTLALYHFDEGDGDVLKDASGNGHDGRIFGATWVKPDGSPIEAQLNDGLRFERTSDHVDVPTLEYDGGPVTVEALLEWRGGEGGTMVASTSGQRSAGLWISEQQAGFSVRIDDNGTNQLAKCRGEFVPTGQLVHLAGVYDGERTMLFVDGKQRGIQLEQPGRMPPIPGTLLGHPEACFPGVLRELRISNSARYTEDFTPAEGLVPDEHTIALYHFDEGEGDVLVDSSGNDHHGQIHGARWSPVDSLNTTPINVPVNADSPLTWTGDARIWSVDQDGVLHGIGTPSDQFINTFLVTEQQIHNFELELEFKLIDGNSGIQFRNQTDPQGRAKGFQVEINPGIFGDLYQSPGQGFVEQVTGVNRDGINASIRQQEWSHLFLKCEDNLITLKINEILAIDRTVPGPAPSGSIGFQLHGTNAEVAFKSIRLRNLEAVPRMDDQQISFESRHTLRALGGRPECVTFAPDGSQLALASNDGRITFHELPSMRPLETFAAHDDGINVIAFTPDSEILISGAEDGSLQLWNARTTEQLETLIPEGIPIRGTSVSRDGTRIAACNGEGGIFVWDRSALNDAPLTMQHGDRAYGVSFSADGQRLVSCAADETVLIWDLDNVDAPEVLLTSPIRIDHVKFSPDGTTIAVCNANGDIMLWDVQTQEIASTIKAHRGVITRIAWDTDGVRLASASRDGTARVWDAATGELVATVNSHDGIVSCVAFSADGTLLATTGYDNVLSIWDVVWERQP